MGDQCDYAPGMNSGWLIGLSAALCLACPGELRADGKVFSQVSAVRTTTPDQRALVHFAGGMETLVVETSFVGAGTNFAWVVPLPAAPEITAVPRTVFTNLERLFQPEVIHKQPNWWLGMSVVAMLIASAIWRAGKQGGCLEWLLLVGILMLLAIIAIPNFVMSRSAAGISIEPTGVQILSRQTVGVFDTITLSSPDGLVLTRWLNDNGFAVPATAAPIIADYAKQGWVFAAAKLSRPDATGKTSPHPLAFKFKTDRAVYPLRLTGVDNGRCLVELYVFGNSRAALPGFKVEQCLATEFPVELQKGASPWDAVDFAAFREAGPGQLRIRHPALRSLVAGATVGTKLSGELDTETMSRDAYLSWVPFKRQLTSYYSYSGARTRAANAGMAVLLAGIVGVALWLRHKAHAWTGRLRVRVVGCALVAGIGYYVALPKVEVEIKHGWHLSLGGRQNSLRTFDGGVQQLILELSSPTNRTALPEEWDLAALLSALKPFYRYEVPFQNAVSGKPLSAESTPGNLRFRRTERGTELIWHDVDCVEHVLGTLPTRAP